MLYTIYVFDRQGTCIYYKEWNHDGMKRRKRTPQEVIGDQKLMFGLVFSLKAFTTGIAPKP